jgi:TfoX/Sxy family transcriptional regulator of competence genes
MSVMSDRSMPKSSVDANTAFRALLPADPQVKVRPMFGNLAAFVNGNMFAGLFGDDLFVRVGEEERAALIEQGGSPFEPMAGRPMKAYVVVPSTWSSDPDTARAWLARSLAGAGSLPPKEARRPRS